MADYDAIVIGAGYGGVTVGALLAKAGRRVLLLEKNNEPGGKGATIKRRGYVYEMWGGVGVPARDSRFHELAAAIGKESEIDFLFPEGDASELKFKGPDGVWRGSIGRANQAEDPTIVDRMKNVFGATDDDLAAMGKMFADVMTIPEESLDDLDDVGMLGWMREFGLPESLLAQICVSLNLLFCAPVNRVPVSEAVRTLRDVYGKGAGRYSAGGYGKLAELAAAYVVEHGGAFVTRARVEQVLVEEGRAVGVRTSDGEFRAPVVISNAGIQPTVLKLVGEDHLPADYVERVRSLEPSWGIVGARYFLDAPVLKVPMSLAYSTESWWDDDRYAAVQEGNWPDASLVFVGVPSMWDPGAVPDAGHQVAISASLGPADPRSPLNEEALERSEATIREVWPEIFEHLVRREPYHAQHVSRMTRDSVLPGQGGEAIGLAQVIGQCGRSKPDPRTPLPGLYLVGADAGGHGAGTHQAADSGFNVAEMVLADTGGPGPDADR